MAIKYSVKTVAERKMKKQIVRMALLGTTAGAMLVVSALILPTVALSTTDCAESGAAALQSRECTSQPAPTSATLRQDVRNP